MPLPPAPVWFTVAPPAKLMVLPLAFWMTMVSGAPLDIVAAPLTVTLPPPPLCVYALPLPPETLSVPNVRVPPAAPLMLTPFPPPVHDAFPKLMLAAELEITMHSLLLPDTVVEPNATVPATATKLSPEVLLDVVVTLANAEVAASVPVARFNACPVPFNVMSGVVLSPTVSVPKLAPEAILVPVPTFPIVKPRSVLLFPTPMLTAFTFVVVIVGLAPPVAGNASLKLGTVTPEMVARLAEAPAPISF